MSNDYINEIIIKDNIVLSIWIIEEFNNMIYYIK